MLGDEASVGAIQGGDRGPLTLVPFTVGTYLVVLEFQQSLDSLRVLGSLAWSRTSRHNSSNSRIDGERDRETMRATQLFLGGGRHSCGLRLRCIYGWGKMPVTQFDVE